MTSNAARTRVTYTVQNLGLHPIAIDIAELEIEEILTKNMFDLVQQTLADQGFELIVDRDLILIEKIKSVVIETIHGRDELPTINYSDFISKKLNANYTYLSKLFSKAKNITLEQYIITQKIERVKHLLLYNDFTLSEIAWRMQYSSTAHLSAQFKKVTNLTISDFKKMKNKPLTPVENL